MGQGGGPWSLRRVMLTTDLHPQAALCLAIPQVTSVPRPGGHRCVGWRWAAGISCSPQAPRSSPPGRRAGDDQCA